MNFIAQQNRTRRLDSMVAHALRKYGLDYDALKEWVAMIESVQGDCPELHKIMKVEFVAAGGTRIET